MPLLTAKSRWGAMPSSERKEKKKKRLRLSASI